MRYLLTLFLLFPFQISTFAHDGGHNNTKQWIINNKEVKAELLKYEDGKVYFLNQKHKLLVYNIQALSSKGQETILKEHLKISHLNHRQLKSGNFSKILLPLGLGCLLICVSILLYLKQKKTINILYGLIGLGILTISACSNGNDSITNSPINHIIPPNNVSFLTKIFGNFSSVSTTSDNEWFYIESNGLPNHEMMTGITNWQQQVPINHFYTGSNNWAIPIQPTLSDNPLDTKTNLLKGAIAIAANGIPIFNPLNNRGEDANIIGELDKQGGHCGRADDYHYHLPPLHLQPTVGIGNPIAYALDGFPVYGETTEQLDEYLGRFTNDGSYQYHTITEYPYFIAGMRGVVTIDSNTSAPENQIIPQAMSQGVRPALEPLIGAEITSFSSIGNNSYSLTYQLNTEEYMINYQWDANNLYTYEFIKPNGSSIIETYQR